ncbi:MAG: MFS transporter [Synergistaceae bacterium]|nr:MFS transporter [Synergistaceae bacterium]
MNYADKQASGGAVRWIYLATAVIVLLFAGVIYAWSILKAPLAAEFGWSQGALGLNYTVMMCCYCLGGMVGGALIRRFPIRVIFIFAGVLVGGGFYLSSSISGRSIISLYISYGALCGLGIGIVYTVVISAVGEWFQDKRATASGIMLMGFGAGSLILGSIAGNMIKSVGWRSTLSTIGVSVLIVFCVGSFIIKAADPSGASFANVRKNGGGAREYTTREMLHRVSFWKFYIFSVLIATVGSCVISMARDVALFVGTEESVAVTLTGLLSVCNGAIRIVIGIVFDRFGRRVAMLVTCLLTIIASSAMLGATMIGSFVLLVVGIVLTGASYGCLPTLSSGFISSAYGAGNFPMNFSISTTMLLFASFAAPIAGWMTGTAGGYPAAFISLLVLSFVGTAISMSLKEI